MTAAKEELTIQIRNVDRVEIDDLDPPKSGQRHVFEKFAPDSTRPDAKYIRGLYLVEHLFAHGSLQTCQRMRRHVASSFDLTTRGLVL
mmetsp:Transcript_2886/g.7934  ORF Transcript_2886/g.7934 Transcript_2886/m.7934 type:complete len:88 (-) Transcript_2886:83-346(-)